MDEPRCDRPHTGWQPIQPRLLFNHCERLPVNFTRIANIGIRRQSRSLLFHAVRPERVVSMWIRVMVVIMMMVMIVAMVMTMMVVM